MLCFLVTLPTVPSPCRLCVGKVIVQRSVQESSLEESDPQYSVDVCSELGGAEKESCRGYCGSMFDFMHREIW